MHGLMGARFLKKFRKKNPRRARIISANGAELTNNAQVTRALSSLENQPLQGREAPSNNLEPKKDVFPAPAPLTETEADSGATQTPDELDGKTN